MIAPGFIFEILEFAFWSFDMATDPVILGFIGNRMLELSAMELVQHETLTPEALIALVEELASSQEIRVHDRISFGRLYVEQGYAQAFLVANKYLRNTFLWREYERTRHETEGDRATAQPGRHLG